MLLATDNATKFAQNCPKTISLKNFEMPPKFEIFIFFKKLKNTYAKKALK
jgi:hypothetical protein